MSAKKLLEHYKPVWSEDSMRIFATPSSTAKSLYFYVQEVGYFKTLPPYYTERENLVSFLVLYTIEGEGTLDYEGKTYTLEKGDAFFLNCHNHHRYQCIKKKGWEFIWLHFNGLQALGYYQEFIRNSSPVLRPSFNNPLEKNLLEILEETKKKSVHTEVKSSNLINTLLTDLIMDTTAGESTLVNIPDFIQKAFTFMDKHFEESLTLNDLSKEVGVSKYYLSREFKKHMGQTLMEYLISLRINYAKELLRYTSLNIAQIAERCGIPHETHFINLFKRKEEVTPHKYRMLWKESSDSPLESFHNAP
ncbi:AraC-like DNA-binding protein [Aequitasia blattaphilus]|uniref:Helix-turn-helix domain-containing protein n=1 Tax=Aequitasia blattaphilus TaxID=2949332 RepID=A0ABT1E8S7_9FIRM|nr:helix-turn-helix domain-containing protein [Aequitasia blattaphilus]MCP1102220.1 helix-turn-helix domain-containing protein [Aequitasia blattaphilus]MCR8614860.1 helix-turn-helix domain-containing protein [Aequitasia blattaphilus]